MEGFNHCIYQCVTDPEWKKTTIDHGWEGFVECLRKPDFNCKSRVQFGNDLLMCACPLGVYVTKHRRDETELGMDCLKIAMIVSDDKDIREQFAKLLEKIHVSYIFESTRANAMIRVMEVDVNVLIADLKQEWENDLDFLRVVKKLRPRLPIIAITGDMSEEWRKGLLNAGARYCLLKPMKEEEAANMLGAMIETA